jgi:uncharacterized protein with HEPN domain
MYLRDMLECCDRIARYPGGRDEDCLRRDDVRYDAVLRNLEVLGEAAKRVPESIRQQLPGIDWRGAAGMRDVLIHGYAGIEFETVWDVASRKLPSVAEELGRPLASPP